MSAKIHTAPRCPKLKRYVLEIPGTHGTWPHRNDWHISKTGAYVCFTRETRQVSYFLSWGYSYVRTENGKKVKVF